MKLLSKCKVCAGSMLPVRVRDHLEDYSGYKCVLCSREVITKEYRSYDIGRILLSRGKVKRIKVLLERGRSLHKIAEKFDIPPYLVTEIQEGKRYRRVKIKFRDK